MFRFRRGAASLRSPAVDQIPSKVRPKRQARIERAKLRKLKSTGLFRGKIDLRKAPTPAAKRALKRFRAVIEGKAKVLKPKSPGSYRKVFRVIGDKVIVPHRKGDALRIDKAGKINVRRKIAGRVRRGRYEKIEGLAPEAGALFVLPLQHGDDTKFYSFGSHDDLLKFVHETSPKVGQTFKNFASYVLKIDPVKMERAIDRGDVSDEDEYFENQLHARLSRRIKARQRRIKPPARKVRKAVRWHK